MYPTSSILLAAVAFSASSEFAVRAAPSDDALILAEIILPAKPGVAQESGGATQADRARGYRLGGESGIPPANVQEPTDGVMAPREALPVERARRNRSRASEYQQPPGTPSVTIPPPSVESGDGVRYLPGRGSDNRSRASAYAGTRDPSSSAIRMGADGVLIVPCGPAGNISGRIGEAHEHGDIFMIVRDRKLQRARCE